MKTATFILALLLGLSSTWGWASDWKALGSYWTSGQSRQAFELTAIHLYHPFPDREFLAGPRVGASFLSSPGSGTEFSLGIEGSLYLANALGGGLAFDWVYLAGGEGLGGRHIRVEPFLSIRLKRLMNAGGLSLRIGTLWDSLTQWGVRLGVGIQFSGIK